MTILNKINEKFISFMCNKQKRKIILWKIIENIEMLLRAFYNCLALFVPALVFSRLYNTNNFIVFILLVAGMFKMIYKIFECYSIKEIYLKLRWKIKSK